MEFVKSKLYLTVLLCLVCTYVFGQDTYVRYNLISKKGQAHLKAYNRAIAEMKMLNCDHPRSWFFQGAIHGVVDPDAVGPQSQDGISIDPEGCMNYQWNYQKLVFNETCKEPWGTCNHQYAEEPFTFLVWHRLYLYHFERTIRSFLEEGSDFALPYWDYTKLDQRVLPERFRDSNSKLYTSSRDLDVNSGSPMRWLPAIYNDSVDYFQYYVDQLQTFDSWDGFLTGMGQGLHGLVHMSVGGDYRKYNKDKSGSDKVFVENEILRKPTEIGLMSNTTTAGYDPIFYIHHTQIDRLWEQWKTKHPEQAAKAGLDELIKDDFNQYIFYDPELGRVRYSIEEAWEKYKEIQETIFYDSLPEELRDSPATEELLQDNLRIELLSVQAEQSIKMNSGLLIEAPESLSFNAFDRSNIKKRNQEDFVLQALIELSSTSEPLPFSVYLKDDNNVKEYLVGLVASFGAAHHHEHGSGHRITIDFKLELPSELEDLDLFDIERGEKIHDFEIIFRSALEQQQDIRLESFKLEAVILN